MTSRNTNNVEQRPPDEPTKLTGSLQNLSRPIVPPPVPPRTPQVRTATRRPLPPLPIRPSFIHQQQQQQQRNPHHHPPEFFPPPPPLPEGDVTPGQRIDQDPISDESEEDEPVFARCSIVKKIKKPAPPPPVPPPPPELLDDQKEVPSTSGSGSRLRPPLANIVGVSADSGTGFDTGSAEIDGSGGTGRPTVHDETNNRRDDDEDDEEDEDEEGVDDYEPEQQQLQKTFSVSKQPLANKGAKQQVKPFTKDSLERLENKHVQLVRDYGFQPKRKTSVEDGGVLPNKFEPFPSNLYNRPLEEIDSFIYDEVSIFNLFFYLETSKIFLKKCYKTLSSKYLTKIYIKVKNFRKKVV